MPLRFFSVSARSPDPSIQEELNQFLAGQRVVNITKELVSEPSGTFWAIAVDYLPGTALGAGSSRSKSNSKQIDYKEILDPAEFALFAALREVRKEIATREGVPIYTIFTNQQLADIVTERVDSKAGLAKIKGVGSSRVEKYGDEYLSRIDNFRAEKHEADEQSIPADS